MGIKYADDDMRNCLKQKTFIFDYDQQLGLQKKGLPTFLSLFFAWENVKGVRKYVHSAKHLIFLSKNVH